MKTMVSMLVLGSALMFSSLGLAETGSVSVDTQAQIQTNATTSDVSATPPGMEPRGNLPPGLEKQKKHPRGWHRGKKTGWRMHEKRLHQRQQQQGYGKPNKF